VTELWDDLLDCLDLHGSAASGFEGSNLKLPYHRLFGGQMLAQFVRAASLSCRPSGPEGDDQEPGRWPW
jgi:acyl-CoA thioesterase-2